MAPQTTTVREAMGKKSVIALIDSGSTHNFIDPTMARRVGIAIKKGGSLEVMVANGEKLRSSGHYEKVLLSI